MKTINYRSYEDVEASLTKKNETNKHGLIFIADISGFSKFVRETDVIEGSKITRILLSSIIDSNFLNLEVCEIEGDAIFFYKYGNLAPICSILKQYEVMLELFNAKLRKIKVHYKKKLDLSLKVIAHFGTIAEYNIGNFKKLYGESVIEAHHLLKNKIPSKSYILLTDELLKSSGRNYSEKHCLSSNAISLSESFGADTTLQYTYVDYQTSNVESSIIRHNCNQPL